MIPISPRAATVSGACATVCCSRSRSYLSNCRGGLMWIDTHCHLDASEFDADRDDVAASALKEGVQRIVIPGVERQNFDRVRELAHRIEGGAYALGIHPLFTPRAQDDDLRVLREQIAASLGDPRFVGIGDIGLDYFVPGLDDARQAFFYYEPLNAGGDLTFPVFSPFRK